MTKQGEVRDWNKDMELCEKMQRNEGWSVRDQIAEQPQMSIYWLQQYAAEKERGDKAETCEQKLREAVEELLSIFDDNGSWHMVEVENGFSYNLSPSDEYVVSFAKKLLASLYPKEEEVK